MESPTCMNPIMQLALGTVPLARHLTSRASVLEDDMHEVIIRSQSPPCAFYQSAARGLKV